LTSRLRKTEGDLGFSLLLPVFFERADALERVAARWELCATAHAEGQRGHAGRGGAVRAGVTVLTIDPKEAGAALVAEGDRLLRAGRIGFPCGAEPPVGTPTDGVIRSASDQRSLERRAGPSKGLSSQSDLVRDIVRDHLRWDLVWDLVRRRDRWGANAMRCRLPAP
jgi:hypothetical protein